MYVVLLHNRDLMAACLSEYIATSCPGIVDLNSHSTPAMIAKSNDGKTLQSVKA